MSRSLLKLGGGFSGGLATLLAGLALAQSQQAPEKLTSETKLSTSAGATYTAPAGWSVRSSRSMVILDPPEPDSHLAIVDVKAADAAAAVTAAWSSYKPDFRRAVKLTTPAPPRDGWEERKNFSYETSPNERAVIAALASRAGDRWTVVLLDATEPTFEKRGSQFALIIQSLRPGGYQKESFAGRKALPLTTERVQDIKNFVETSMKKLGIPGASLALVDQGKVVFEGGFGARELGKSEPVDANTLFMAASNTKGMTTLLLSRLADEKNYDGISPSLSFTRRLSWAMPIPPGRYSSNIWSAPARVCRDRIWSGSLSSRTPRQKVPWPCSARCSRPASSGKCFSTAT